MRRLKDGGFSLVELMVAMVAGLILVAAVTMLFVTTLRANSTAMKVSRLNQELQGVTDMIARDIQRAGYDASAATSLRLVSGATHPFYFDANTDWNNACVLVRYDGRNIDNAPSSANGIPEDNEAVVYSYRADKSVWVDELSVAEFYAAVSSSLSTLCNVSGANRISTEGTIEITQFNFSFFPSSKPDGARAIKLEITGSYKDNPELTLSLSRDIKLRNDGY